MRNDFTTFFNAVGDPGADRAIDRFVETQVRGFSRITQAAAQASQAASGVLRGTGGAGALTSTNRALATQATESRRVAAATMETARVAPLAAAGQRRQTIAALEGARANNTLARSLTAASTALTVVQGPLGPLAGRFGAASRAIGTLGAVALGASAAAVVAAGVIRLGNAYTQTEAKLRPFFETQMQVNLAMSQVAGIANRSRASLEATADLYGRLTQNAANYNIAQNRIGRITEIAAKAAALSGGSAQSQEAGLYQFAQAIGSNRLGGDELRSILENTSQLANAIAQGMGVTVGRLRELGAAGVLTTQVVVAALERAGATVDERFAKLPVTLGSAAQVFTNNLEIMVGRFDRAIGLSSGLAQAILAVGNNLHLITSAAAGVGVAFAAIKVGSWVNGLTLARQEVAVLNTALAELIATESAEAAVQNAAAAQAARTATVRISALRAEKLAIEENILAQAGQLGSARSTLAQNAFRSQIGRPVSGLTQSVALGEEAAAIGRLRTLQTDLANTTSRLSVATLAGAEAHNAAAAAAMTNRSALANVAAVEAEGAVKTSFFGTALRSVAGTFNPWVVGITALAGGIIYLATAETDAERATRLASEALENYGRIVDQTTGRVNNLSDSIRKALVARQQAIVDAFHSGDRGNFEGDAGVGGRLAARLQQYTVAPGMNFAGQAPFDEQGAAAYNQRINALAQALSQNGEQAQRALQLIQRAAAGAHPELRAYIDDNQDLIDRFNQLREAGETAANSIRVAMGGLDPAVLLRMTEAAARFNAEFPLRIQAIHQQSVNENTLGDNARYQQNLTEVTQAAGNNRYGRPLQTPAQLQAQNRAIRYFETEGRVANATRTQIDNYNRAHAQMVRQRDEDYAASREVFPQLQAEARFRTQQQTAQRDQERAAAAQRRQEAAERRAQAEQERQQNLIGRRTDILGRYTPEPSQTQRADAAVRDLQDIQRQLGQGLYPQAAMEADVARIRDGLNRALLTTLNERRDSILGRYQDEPRRVVRAGLDINTLRQQQQLLGEGLYPRATMEADIARINEGVLKPFRDIVEASDRQRTIQMLILQGRQAEATALGQAFNLVDSIGKVSEAQYAILVRNAVAEQQINDVLASRERMVSLLQGSVDDVRTSLEQALMASTDLTKAPQAFGQFLQQSINRVQQIGIRSLVERVTAGADERVRALISGEGAVDVASRTFAAQLTAAGGSSDELATSNRRAGDIIVSAATDFANRIQAINIPTSVGAPAAGGDTSTLDVWQNSGTGRAGLGLPPAAAVAMAAISRQERLRLPFSTGSISSGFGARTRPMAGASAYHPGLDFAQPFGTPVPAALSGRVVPTTAHGLGNAVTIDSGHGLQELYGHLSRLNVTMGQLVHQGDIIGQVGSTGVSTGNHLHFGITQNGVALDPRLHLGSRLIEAAAAAGGVRPIGVPPAQTPAAQQSAQAFADQMMADQLASMRRSGVTSTAAALGAYGTVKPTAPGQQHLPSGAAAYNEIGRNIGGEFDRSLNSIFGGNSKFFSKIGGSFGTALEGAGQGAIASGFAKAIGIKQSNTGAQIGGAAGSVIASSLGLPPALGGFVGGLIGGTIGGLFMKTKAASSTISFSSATGGLTTNLANSNNKASRLAATGASGTVVSSLEDIAHQLFGEVGNFGSLSIGTRKDKFVVDPSGRGRTKGSGTQSFASEQEAIAFALQTAIQRGAIQGISAASQHILQSGQDLQRAISKAVIIESIPRQLLQRTNPVRFAVEELNREFTYTIQILKEAGATGEQFAQAQKLYDLQRADSVKQASDAMFGQIQAYLKEMTGGSSSPLNKLTVYQNAKSEFDKFQESIKTGIFSQDDLLTAAKNFQDAARSYEGSGSAFFQDFEYIFSLLSQAKANAAGLAGTATDLPASPFAGDATIQALIDQFNGQTNAIDNQTGVLGGLLGDIYDLLSGASAGGGGGGSTIFNLPAFVNGGGGGADVQNK